ncbi:hypothetical protein V1505DRAFT_381036 [Lipomyces doorenjongii]
MLIRAFQTLVVPSIGKSVEDGAKSKHGKRYCEQGIMSLLESPEGRDQSRDTDLAWELWEWTETEVKEHC